MPISSESLRPNPFYQVGRTITTADNPRRALVEAGLNWSVTKKALYTDDFRAVPAHRAICRDDNGTILGIVGENYEPFQNGDILELFRDLASEAPLRFETAGYFNGGKVVWMLAHLPDLQIAIGDDVSESYLLISSSHDGSKAITIGPTSIRVICSNTLAMAEASIQSRKKRGLAGAYSVKHTAGLRQALDDIRCAYRRTIDNRKKTEEAYRFLAGSPLSESMVQQVFRQALDGKPGPDESQRSRTIRENREHRIRTLLHEPTNQVRGTRNSAFSLLQAVGEWVDHERTTRGEDSSGKRLQSATMGSGAVIKNKTWETLLALA